MASNFSLYKPKAKTFPHIINVGRMAYAINPDYRVVLKIFKMLGDNNIFDAQKIKLLSNWF